MKCILIETLSHAKGPKILNGFKFGIFIARFPSYTLQFSELYTAVFRVIHCRIVETIFSHEISSSNSSHPPEMELREYLAASPRNLNSHLLECIWINVQLHM